MFTQGFIYSEFIVVINGMYVNEYERLQYYTWVQIEVKKQRFYCCFTFYSHKRVFNNLDLLGSFCLINQKSLDNAMKWFITYILIKIYSS